jgi:curved DNA-binding protein CbpA
MSSSSLYTAAAAATTTQTQCPTRGVLLQSSLSQTYHALLKHDPESIEQDQIRRAMELSLLDCALVIRRTAVPTPPTTVNEAAVDTFPNHPTRKEEDPYHILGLSCHSTSSQINQPTLTDIKTAYRQRALQTHPDRPGGNETAFQQVARAYRTLLLQQQQSSSSSSSDFLPSRQSIQKQIKGTAHWDKELIHHQKLVQELYAGSSQALKERQIIQQNVIQHVLYLQTWNAGSTNMDEQQQILYNSCFYLSLAASYLAGIGALVGFDNLDKNHYDDRNDYYYQQQQGMTSSSNFGLEDRYLIGETALHLKRTIEAAVLKAHPEWAVQGKVGDHVQAFSDFLVYLLDSSDSTTTTGGTLVSEWAVIVFDTTSGVADVYKGQYYQEEDKTMAASNCLTLQYTPGHYEALLPCNPATNPRPTLSQILQILDANNIFYVVTDGTSS